MSKTKLAVCIASCLAIAAPALLAGDRSADAADRQQAVEHSREVQRMKQRDQESAWERREQAEKDKAKVKEHVEKEEDIGKDLDDDEGDGTE